MPHRCGRPLTRAMRASQPAPHRCGRRRTRAMRAFPKTTRRRPAPGETPRGVPCEDATRFRTVRLVLERAAPRADGELANDQRQVGTRGAGKAQRAEIQMRGQGTQHGARLHGPKEGRARRRAHVVAHIGARATHDGLKQLPRLGRKPAGKSRTRSPQVVGGQADRSAAQHVRRDLRVPDAINGAECNAIWDTAMHTSRDARSNESVHRHTERRNSEDAQLRVSKNRGEDSASRDARISESGEDRTLARTRRMTLGSKQ